MYVVAVNVLSIMEPSKNMNEKGLKRCDPGDHAGVVGLSLIGLIVVLRDTDT